MAFYTQVSTCIYKLEQDKLHAVTPLHSFVLVVSRGLLSDGRSWKVLESHIIVGNYYAPSHNTCILSFVVYYALDCTRAVNLYAHV